MEVNIGSVLYNRAVTMGEKIGFVHCDRRLTFTEMNERANSFSAFLKKKGFTKGKTIAILCKNNEQAIACFFGAAKIGVISVMVNWRHQTDEMQYILSHSDVKMIVYDQAFQPVIDKLKVRLPEMMYVSATTTPSISTIWQQPAEEPVYDSTGNDPILLMYTIGTTGKLKGVLLSHNNLLATSVGLSQTIDWRESDRYLAVASFFYIGGFPQMITNVHAGATMILMEEFNPVAVWQTIEAERITSMMTVPSLLAELLKAYPAVQSDFSSLRYINCGASALQEPLLLEFRKMGIPIQKVYGITEFSGAATIWKEGQSRDKHNSVGKPVMHGTVQIVDYESKEELSNGEIGEIVVGGPQVFVGYHKNEEAYMQTVVGGKFHTGDVGYLDEDGFLHIVDRLKNMISSGGENIYSTELELELLQHPGVAEVAVVGAPSDMWGEVPRAFIVRREGAYLTETEVIAFSKERLAPSKTIKEVTFVDQFPRNAVGKIIKPSLKDMAAVL